MNATVIAVILGVGIIGSVIILSWGTRGGDDQANKAQGEVNNVSVVEGKQIIDLTARGGYSPRKSVAQAGLPTTIRMKTSGTFDCSSALVIPSINYQKNLPQSGVTEIEVPPQTVGTKLQGLCSMGMYNFEIEFD
ncbi:MAG: hypothetical protein K9M10_03780 [Candidatus Pacebacteria bacterium]|nr:hypothetical protein [Candidatus Paceibacterota bacterium]MCF7857572.1 hypothetical protein [Candidatus Paceibacterota bacterium]